MAATFRARTSVEEAEAVRAFVRAELEAGGMMQKSIRQLDLAIDELFGNIALHSDGGDGTAEISVSIEDGTAVITLTDSGAPFDPTTIKEPDLTASADERPIGGLGIFLARRLTDRMTYERAGEKNILRLYKDLRS